MGGIEKYLRREGHRARGHTTRVRSCVLPYRMGAKGQVLPFALNAQNKV